jgi:hypothetical protein
MNRRAIIAAIGALWAANKAAGQKPKSPVECKDGECNWVGPPPTWPTPYKPAPNQCPIPTCGTMAEPFKRPVVQKDEIVMCPDLPPTSTLGCMLSEGTPYGPTERITRCKRCSAAFWQTAVN